MVCQGHKPSSSCHPYFSPKQVPVSVRLGLEEWVRARPRERRGEANAEDPGTCPGVEPEEGPGATFSRSFSAFSRSTSSCRENRRGQSHRVGRIPELGLPSAQLSAQIRTCILCIVSRSWSSWWAELRASKRMSVSFISFSHSSERSSDTSFFSGSSSSLPWNSLVWGPG